MKTLTTALLLLVSLFGNSQTITVKDVNSAKYSVYTSAGTNTAISNALLTPNATIKTLQSQVAFLQTTVNSQDIALQTLQANYAAAIARMDAKDKVIDSLVTVTKGLKTLVPGTGISFTAVDSTTVKINRL